MTAIEAMVYCLGYVHDEPEDGEYRSQTVYDRNGDAHWFAWALKPHWHDMPSLHSGCPYPFAGDLEPYTMSRVEENAT